MTPLREQLKAGAGNVFARIRSERMGEAIETLEAMRNELGERTVKNLYAFDDIQACLYLAKALQHEVGELLNSIETI